MAAPTSDRPRRLPIGWLSETLRPSTAPWAVGPAAWAVLAASGVAVAGVLTDRLDETGLAYFGVACAAIFVTSGAYRTRLLAGVIQAVGAGAGIVLGILVADSDAEKIAVAAAVALLSGLIGAIGRLAAAGALMALIGLAFGEFARIDLATWQQPLWYGAGTLLVLILAIAAWPFRRDRPEWQSVAAVFEQSARLFEAVGTAAASSVRADLAAASATSRTEVYDHRLGRSANARRQRLLAAAASADEVALVAAEAYARGIRRSSEVVASVGAAGQRCRVGRTPALAEGLLVRAPVPRSTPPFTERIGAAGRAATSPAAVIIGLRVALCMTIATGVTCALHHESHSYWLPLTVAVAVRPEYGTVFMRTINRVAGTLAGGLIAAAALFALHTGWPVAVAAALSLGFAALAAPKIYGLSVVGVTCSALLSASIGHADPSTPAVRILDTLLGAAIALIFGYLLWPGRRSLPAQLALPAAADATAAYLELAGGPPTDRDGLAAARDQAYRLAHQSRQALQSALREPPPVRDQAAALLPSALALEDIVDEITAFANRIEAGHPLAETDSMGLVGDEARDGTESREVLSQRIATIAMGWRHDPDEPVEPHGHPQDPELLGQPGTRPVGL
jgi:uncharacterized membrane protein YccC